MAFIYLHLSVEGIVINPEELKLQYRKDYLKKMKASYDLAQ